MDRCRGAAGLPILLLSLSLIGCAAATEIVHPVESAGEYASPTLGAGPARFEVPGFVTRFEGDACDRSSGREHSDALAGRIVVLGSSHSCNPQELAEFAQDAGAIGAIVVSSTSNPGSVAFSYDGDDHAGLAIPSLEMSERDWDAIGHPKAENGTFAVLRPTENPWRNVQSRWQWGMFSATFGSIAFVELVVCLRKLHGYFVEYGRWKRICGGRIPVYEVRWALPEIVLELELAGLLLRIVFFFDPGSVNGVYTSATALSLRRTSPYSTAWIIIKRITPYWDCMPTPASRMTNILVGLYWLHLLANDLKLPSRTSTISLGRWKWPCVGAISTMVLLELVNNVMGDVYPPSIAVSGPFSGALYGAAYLIASPLFFYGNWKMRSRIKHVQNPTLNTVRFVKKLNWLMIVSGLGSVLVFAGPVIVATRVAFEDPVGFAFVYWDMFTGLSLLSGSQISMFGAKRNAQTDTKVTMTKTKVESDEEDANPPDSESEDSHLPSSSSE